MSTLQSAAKKGDADKIITLISEGIDVNKRYGLGETPLIIAAEHGKKKAVITLIAAGAKMDITDVYGDTALIKAAEKGHLSVMDSLISAGAKMNIQNRIERTALMETYMHGHFNAMKKLLKAGANMDIPINTTRSTILMQAAEKNDEKVVKLLVSYGADIGVEDKYGKTAIDYCKQKELKNYLQRSFMKQISELLMSEIEKVDREPHKTYPTVFPFPKAGGHTKLFDEIVEYIRGI